MNLHRAALSLPVMRPDMDKVIVERPRLGGGVRRPKGIRKRERLAFDDQLPKCEGYRRRWTSWSKHLNEHLAPLRRYLQSQVGRPWNKVHSEICRQLRLDSAVQSHVLDHLWEYVEVHTRLVDGIPCNAVGTPLQLLYGRVLYYVCPKSGLLKSVRRARVQKAIARPKYVTIDERHQWHKVNGIWFEIELADAAGASSRAYDTIFKTELALIRPDELYEAYGSHAYATRKRQLGKRKARLAEHRLAARAKSSSRQ